MHAIPRSSDLLPNSSVVQSGHSADVCEVGAISIFIVKLMDTEQKAICILNAGVVGGLWFWEISFVIFDMLSVRGWCYHHMCEARFKIHSSRMNWRWAKVERFNSICIWEKHDDRFCCEEWSRCVKFAHCMQVQLRWLRADWEDWSNTSNEWLHTLWDQSLGFQSGWALSCLPYSKGTIARCAFTRRQGSLHGGTTVSQRTMGSLVEFYFTAELVWRLGGN